MSGDWNMLRSPGGDDAGGSPVPPPPRRAGSMTLREGAGATSENALDPANQSLADALRVMMRLLQLAMLILGVLYLMSGLQSVKEGERAIRLLFGKKVDENLEPGFRWSAPYPMGELVKINQGYRELDISKDFWIYIQPGTADPSPEKQNPTASLKPDQGGSGSVITADGNIAHTKWKVGFERESVGKFAQNVLPEDEDALVLAAVKRGVVQAIAQVPLNDLLQQSSVNGTTVPEMAKRVAQNTLDRLNSGLRIKALTMDPPIPPLAVRADFNKASAAAANANKVIQEAQTYRTETLNRAAGGVARHLVYYIDQYEHALARKDAAGADQVLATINKLMDGSTVDVPALDENGKPEVDDHGTATGRTVKIEKLATGEVASTLNDAALYRTGVVSRAQSDQSRYQAKLQQFEANPSVMVQREWADAVKTFMGRDNVTFTLLPPGMSYIDIILNQDPDIQKTIETYMNEVKRKAAEQKRLEDLKNNGSRTNTGLELRG